MSKQLQKTIRTVGRVSAIMMGIAFTVFMYKALIVGLD
ncbi:hypothetical protein SAMN06296036_1368 [Pseudobacteriovorax antillogorgiicola]|uniref:Uncharacterized protein n=1 Tax=Pseudobacteriovorax antillogorgiicola TaxID=1513793 RepID=A0A1Y6CVJ0_9BACT|nr:hypothetical protein EDD56_13638 [Pseudobacteriovorax antillogorgiicola]SMF81097.1 hypothetical protein SAMN06296036_1368 [Pseudobacteriovorax antillogorgiicola]